MFYVLVDGDIAAEVETREHAEAEVQLILGMHNYEDSVVSIEEVPAELLGG